MISGLRILALTLLASGSASAQDMADWSGPYAGLFVADEGGSQQYYDNDVARPGSIDLDGTMGGVFAGYNFQFGAWVVGPEVELASADVRFDGNGFNHKRFFDLRVRGGYAFGSTLAYAAVGYSQSIWEEGSIEDLDTDGYSLALGIEHRLSDQYFLGAEIMKRRIDSDNFVSLPDARFESDFTAVRLRAGIRF